jgi:hypothetical protein
MLEGPSFAVLLQSGILQQALLGLWTKEVLRVSQGSLALHDSVFSLEGFANFQRASSLLPSSFPRGLHTVDGHLWLHGLLPVRTIKNYAIAFQAANVALATKSSVEYLWGEPLRFYTHGDAEAAGVMWMQLKESIRNDTKNFLVEFQWRPEILKSFFGEPGSSTNSALANITVKDPDGDSEMDDVLRFRVALLPEMSEDGNSSLHRMSLQLVGGKTSSHIYQICFDIIDPAYSLRINVPDHRMPFFQTKEVFHQSHPLMAGLQQRSHLRFLARLQTMETVPLGAQCSCCS